MSYARLLGTVASLLVAAAVVTACGGGGGGSTTPPPIGAPPTPTPGPSSTPIATATPAPTATPNPGLAAQFGASFANAPVQFSCGCTVQAGTGALAADGSLTIAAVSTAVPATPNPTYTIVPGRNYVVIATLPSKKQAWTTVFAGNNPTRNQYLGASTSVDAAATLASLYVFEFSPPPSGTQATFDDWNFNTVSAWVTHLRSAPVATETKAMNDITAQTTYLFPDAGQPLWSPVPSSGNPTIKADLNAIKSDPAAASKPTPCPLNPNGTEACTNTPTP